MQAITATQARAHLYRLIDEAAQSHARILISGKRRDAVLVSAEDWSAIKETLCIPAVPVIRESINAGMDEPLAQSATGLN
jgi:prevent-host-death family protein